MSNRLKPYNRLLGQVSDRVLGRKFILFGLKKVQLGAMTLLFSSCLFIISKFYISTIIVKIQLNDNKFKNINLLFTTQYKLFIYLWHVTFMIVIRSLWYRVFAKENNLVDVRRWQSVASFVTIKLAAEKILSDGTDVDGTAKYRCARTENLEYLSELSFHHTRESVTGIWQFSSHYIVWKTSKL